MAKTKPFQPRMKQTHVPGTEPVHHKDVSDAGERLADAIDELKSVQRGVKVEREHLVAAMKKHKLLTYFDRGLGIRIVLENEDKVKVKRVKENDKDLE